MRRTWTLTHRKTLPQRTRSVYKYLFETVVRLACLLCVEIYRVQKDADDYWKAGTHACDRRALHSRKTRV